MNIPVLFIPVPYPVLLVPVPFHVLVPRPVVVTTPLPALFPFPPVVFIMFVVTVGESGLASSPMIWCRGVHGELGHIDQIINGRLSAAVGISPSHPPNTTVASLEMSGGDYQTTAPIMGPLSHNVWLRYYNHERQRPASWSSPAASSVKPGCIVLHMLSKCSSRFSGSSPCCQAHPSDDH